jgi:hypothetical protein
VVQGSPGKKSSQDPISTKSWAEWCMPIIPAMWGSTNKENHSTHWPKHKVRPYLKNNPMKKELAAWFK